MKGLIIQWLYGSRPYLIGNLALSAAISVIAPILYNSLMLDGDPDSVMIAMLIPIQAILFSCILVLESVTNSFCSALLCKTHGFALTTMKPSKFILSQLSIYAIATVFSILLVAIPITSMAVFIDGYIDTMLLSNIKFAFSYILFAIGAYHINSALIIKVKNRDKAALIILGITLVIAIVAVLIIKALQIEIDAMQLFAAFGNNWYYIAIGVALMLGVGTGLMLMLIKRGEII